jgi:hypothetical protein
MPLLVWPVQTAAAAVTFEQQYFFAAMLKQQL